MKTILSKLLANGGLGNASIRRVTICLVIFAMCAVSCTTNDRSQNSSQAKKVETKMLDGDGARLTLAKYVWDESQKALDYLKMGGGDQDFFAATVRVSNVQQKGNTAEITVFWSQMFMILKGKTAETYQGEGRATFELKDDKWFLTKVSGPRDFMRDNLMVEVK